MYHNSMIGGHLIISNKAIKMHVEIYERKDRKS